jgi:hypothetical protein
MITLMLHFPHADWTVELPAVPRQGETVWWKDGKFTVTSVDWHPELEGPGAVSVELDPSDMKARQVMEQETNEARAEAAEFAKAEGLTGQVVLVSARAGAEVPGVELSDLAHQGRELSFMNGPHPEIDPWFDEVGYTPDRPDELIFAFPAGEARVPGNYPHRTFDVPAADVQTIREAIAAQP